MDTRWSAADLRTLHRSVLFVPGGDERKIGRAREVGADAIVIDLEDAVAPTRKEAARSGLPGAVGSLRSVAPILVRVNDPRTDDGGRDLVAAHQAGATGIMVPKVDSAELLLRCMRGGDVVLPLVPLIESAQAVVGLGDILDRELPLPFAALGTADLSTDLALPSGAVDDDGGILDAARSALVLHSRAAGLGSPVDGPELRVRDLDHLRVRCERAALRGFGGILCLHPAQVEVANELFAPADPDVARAERIIDEFDRSAVDGRGGLTIDGEFVDRPVAERARAVVDMHRAIVRRDHGSSG